MQGITQTARADTEEEVRDEAIAIYNATGPDVRAFVRDTHTGMVPLLKRQGPAEAGAPPSKRRQVRPTQAALILHQVQISDSMAAGLRAQQATELCTQTLCSCSSAECVHFTCRLCLTADLSSPAQPDHCKTSQPKGCLQVSSLASLQATAPQPQLQEAAQGSSSAQPADAGAGADSSPARRDPRLQPKQQPAAASAHLAQQRQQQQHQSTQPTAADGARPVRVTLGARLWANTVNK